MNENLIGTVWQTYQGFYVKIVEIVDKNDVIVEFNDGERCRVRLTNVKLGILMKPTTRGVYFVNAAAKYEGCIMPTVSAKTDIKVIKYNNKNDIEVEFLDTGYHTSVRLDNLRRGSIYNPFLKNNYGGYFGVGPYTKNKHQKVYNSWIKMLERVSELGRSNPKNNSYVNTSVCEEWYNYQNYAFWYDSYLKSLNPDFYNEYQIDKDIKQRGITHKIYSPQTCSVIPAELNYCITYETSSINNKIIESDLPIGVHKVGASYQINLSTSGYNNNKTCGHDFLGSYTNPNDAFKKYKEEKEKYIKYLANKYFNLGAIHEDVYNILMNWEVIDLSKCNN